MKGLMAKQAQTLELLISLKKAVEKTNVIVVDSVSTCRDSYTLYGSRSFDSFKNGQRILFRRIKGSVSTFYLYQSPNLAQYFFLFGHESYSKSGPYGAAITGNHIAFLRTPLWGNRKTIPALIYYY